MTVFGRRGGGGRRDKGRDPVLLNCKLATVIDSRRVVVHDLSCAGAGLRGESLPQAKKDVWIKVGSFEMLGSIVWRKLDSCGVAFDKPLSEQQMKLLRQRSLA